LKERRKKGAARDFRHRSGIRNLERWLRGDWTVEKFVVWRRTWVANEHHSAG